MVDWNAISHRGKNTATRKKLSFAGAVTFVLLLTAHTGAAEVSVCSLAANPKGYDHQNLNLRGTVSELEEVTSRHGNPYTRFKLQGPGQCDVKVFVWKHHSIPQRRSLPCGWHIRNRGSSGTIHIF